MTLDSALLWSWCLVVFRERYVEGWRALIAVDMDLAALVEAELTGGDIGAVEMQRYLGVAGTFFPASSGEDKSPSAALAALADRLGGVPDTDADRWRDQVRDAWEAIRDAHRAARDDEWWMRRALDEGRLMIVE